MLRGLKELVGYTVRAADGLIGQVEDFIIDDDQWKVRYLVVDSENWLSGRRLLFSPRAFGPPNVQERVFLVLPTLEQIQNSPEVQRNRPVGRKDEIDLHSYYQWPFYWTPGDEGALGVGSLAAYPLVELTEEMRKAETATDLEQNPHLRSLQEVTGFAIQARDGAIGHLEDFIVEDEGWKLLYLVVDTGSLLPGKKVLVSPSWVEQVNREASTLQVDLNQETVRDSPEYDPGQPLDREYETRLYSHYGRKKYW